MDSRIRRRRQTDGICGCLKPLIRFWGILTAIVVCGVGVDITMHGHKAGRYILFSSALIFFLEIKWIITLFVQLCTNHDFTSSCGKCWSVVGLAGGWRLAPLYIAIGVALILWPHRLWLSYVAGTQLILLALLRLFTICKYGNLGGPGGKGEGLLPQYDDSFDKYDNFSDGVDDSLPEPGRTLEDEDPIDDV